ncbi:hypothetical protein RB595_006795 [Gaeumannomyces hyphopodioides]
MQFLTLAASALSLLAAPASAAAVGARQAPAPAPIPADGRFNLITLRSGSLVHLSWVSAAKSGLHVRLPAQNASCDRGEDPNQATFYLHDGGLFLHAASATPQQMWVERSWMGQGQTGYTTGAQPLPRNGERTPFRLDEYNNLSFDNVTFMACPGEADGAWSIWVSAGVYEPQGHKNCEGVSLRASPVEQPVSCLYTS